MAERRIGLAMDFSPSSKKALRWTVDTLVRKKTHVKSGRIDRGVAAWLRFLLRGGSGSSVSSGEGGGGAGSAVDGAAAWRGLDEKSVAKLPWRVVAGGEPLDCAVCIAELVTGETTCVLPRCGHGFHIDCVDPWLRSSDRVARHTTFEPGQNSIVGVELRANTSRTRVLQISYGSIRAAVVNSS